MEDAHALSVITLKCGMDSMRSSSDGWHFVGSSVDAQLIRQRYNRGCVVVRRADVPSIASYH